ncbi:MAG TPA: O-antigen ligase family protein [Lacipirellulaceae bacterium]
MQSVAAYPLSGSLSVDARRGQLLAYLRAGTLAVWMFALIYRFWWVSDWFAMQEQLESGVNLKFHYYIGFAIACAAHLTLGLTAWLTLPFKVTATSSGRLFTAFCLLELLTAPFSVVWRTSAMYAVATWSVYALLVLYWESDYRVVQRMTVLAGMVVLGWLVLLRIKHGMPLGFGAAIGGINRNATATAALGGVVCCLLSPRRSIRWAAIAIGAYLCVVVTSRGGIVALSTFLATYYLIYKGTLRAAVHALLGLILFGVLLVASPWLQNFVFEDVMRLHDPARGLGSGFTGRVDAWEQAIDAFWDKPIFGFGFRATTHGFGEDYGAVHSGYLKILVETGFVGAFLILSAVIVEAIRRLRLALRFRQLPPHAAPGIDVVETTRINAIVCATLVLIMTIWTYEQLYFNLGAVVSVAFFLMMAAPTYITTDGVTLRR